jgi:hypothetical protein
LQERNGILHGDPDELARNCLQGTQTILIEHGLGDSNNFELFQ